MSRFAIPAFYINLERDLIRRELLEKELARAGVSAERVAAVDGRAVPAWLGPFTTREWRRERSAVRRSHLIICKTIVEKGLPFALVLEDDARLADDCLATIKSAVQMAPQGWDVIRLVELSPRSSQVLARVAGGRTLVRYLRIPRSTTGLIVSASGAKKLLTRRLIKEPIDVEIRWPWQLDLNVYGIEPPLVIQASGIDLATTIPVRSRPKKLNQLRRMTYNIRKMGLADYLSCRLGLQRLTKASEFHRVNVHSQLAVVRQLDSTSQL